MGGRIVAVRDTNSADPPDSVAGFIKARLATVTIKVLWIECTAFLQAVLNVRLLFKPKPLIA